MMMTGPPGSGKTLLARSMPSISPQLTIDEALDITRVYSVVDALPAYEPLIHHRPFHAPHHTISYAGLIGGGRWPKPGEISLAHRGVLFLDELPEFGTRMLELLRQPLEDRVVSISRSAGSLTYPAKLNLISSGIIVNSLCRSLPFDLRQISAWGGRSPTASRAKRPSTLQFPLDIPSRT